MNGKLLLLILVLATLIAIYRVIRTVLVQRATEHGMTEHEAQKRYQSLFHLLWYRHKEKRTRRQKTETPAEPAVSVKTDAAPHRMQTRWSSIGAVKREK